MAKLLAAALALTILTSACAGDDSASVAVDDVPSLQLLVLDASTGEQLDFLDNPGQEGSDFNGDGCVFTYETVAEIPMRNNYTTQSTRGDIAVHWSDIRQEDGNPLFTLNLS